MCKKAELNSQDKADLETVAWFAYQEFNGSLEYARLLNEMYSLYQTYDFYFTPIEASVAN